MEERRTTNVFYRKPWRYVYAVLIAGTGAILFILGSIIPDVEWLTWLGYAFILAAISYVLSWFIGSKESRPYAGPFITKFFLEGDTKERENRND